MPREFNLSEPLVANDARRLRLGRTLTLIVAIGFALRIAYLASVVRAPGFVWGDPDGYLLHAQMLAHGPHGWHWTFDAVRYDINGQVHALPPLYSVFLSFIALFRGLPLTAQVAQVLLSTASIGIVFGLGRIVHSPAAGLWAAGAYAVSIPSIFGVWSTSQETVYIPLLLLSFWLLARAVTSDARPAAFGIAGLAFGCAALTRSMPMFFVGPAALVHVAMARDRRSAIRQAAAFLAGFALVTVPYCVALSRALGQVTLIDSHGSIHVNADAVANRAPGLAATAGALWDQVAAAPMQFLTDCVARARSLLHVNGGRQLQIYVFADSKPAAMLWKLVVHLGTDVVLVAASVLAVLGAALCRNGRVAALFLLWAALNIAVASVGGFGGARLRSPFEPLLMVLGSVVLAGSWRRPRPLAMTLAVMASIGLAVLVLPQFPRSLRAWPDFGVRWDSVVTREHGAVRGAAGFNVPAYDGVGQILVQPQPPPRSIRLEVRSGGIPVRTLALAGREQRLLWPWPDRGLAFVELRAVDLETGAPADVQITLNPR